MEKIVQNFFHDFSEATGLPICFFSADDIELNDIDLGLRKNLLGLPEDILRKKLLEALSNYEDSTIYYYVDLFQCNYIFLKEPGENSFIKIGPVVFEKITGRRFQQLYEQLKLPQQLRTPLQNYYYGVTYFPSQPLFESFISLISKYYLGGNALHIVYEDENALDDWFSYYDGHLKIPDKPFESLHFIETRYGYENAVIIAVREGNEERAIDRILKLQSMLMPERLTNELRDIKDLSITLNTLLRKAAEDGGVHPIHIDSMSNGNIKQIEQFTEVEQCLSFQLKMIRNYCNLVQKNSLRNYAAPVRKVITYIHTDLTADLSLNSLAEELNINASYLSTLFKKEVGIPLTEYVNRCRIEYAKKLLSHTDFPIKSIALQCGISDLYYFSRMFKRITGTTPKNYRDTYTSK